jgi:hypothetical protein
VTSLGTATKNERGTGAALGVKRTPKRFGARTSDTARVVLPSGVVLQPEVKTRKKLPHLIEWARRQAESYTRGAYGLAVIFKTGSSKGLACLDLDVFARLVGLDVEKLPAPKPLRRVNEKQIEMFEGAT